MKFSRLTKLHLLPGIAAALGLAACASIGRPEGGDRDVLPPVFVRSNPKPGQTNFTGNRVNIFFDENVQLEDAFNKVIVSPVQVQPPSVSSNGKRVSVEMRDTMKPNTTYTIDFGDAIKDLNEGNVLDGFAVDFSTGPTIDTLRISGLVLQADNLEPAQGILVGAYSNLSDTAIRTLPFERVARTNQLGQFTIRNLPPGKYRLYALNDQNRDYKWNRTEDVAFLDYLVEPSVESITVTDTLHSVDGSDSLATHSGVRYLPNDVLLTWFNENYRAQYLKDYKRPDRKRIVIELGAPADSLPRLEVVGGIANALPDSAWALTMPSTQRDTITYWITDPAVLATDSLRLAVTYRRLDSLERLEWKTDTLRFFYKDPKPEKEKKKKKKKDSDTIPEDTVPKMEFLAASLSMRGTQQEVYLPLKLSVNEPLASIDTNAIHFEIKVDTLWEPVGGWRLLPPEEADILTRTITMDWEPGEKYRFTVDSAGMTGIYGLFNNRLSQEFQVRPLEDYSNLVMTVSGTEGRPAIVQLLNSGDAPAYTVALGEDGRADFRYIAPGTYYARLFFDDNQNGKWDTGLLDSIQPEEVFYFPKRLNLKRNWDVEDSWDIYAEPVDTQKPRALVKNKPKLKRGEKAPVDPDEVELDEWGDPIDDRHSTTRPGQRNNNNRGGFGGMKRAGQGSQLAR